MNTQSPSENHKPQGWLSRGFFSAQLVFALTELNYLQQYRQQMSSYLDQILNNFRAQVDNYIEQHNLTEEQADHYYESKIDEHDMYSSFFSDTLKCSIVVSACSLIESRLTEICKELESDSKITIHQTWDNTNDKGIRRANSFLGKNVALRMANSILWSNMIDYFKIRNCIAHADGKVDEMKKPSPSEIRGIISKYHSNGLSESSMRTISVNDTFLDKVLNDMIQFFTELKEQLKINKFTGPIFWP